MERREAILLKAIVASRPSPPVEESTRGVSRDATVVKVVILVTTEVGVVVLIAVFTCFLHAVHLLRFCKRPPCCKMIEETY